LIENDPYASPVIVNGPCRNLKTARDREEMFMSPKDPPASLVSESGRRTSLAIVRNAANGE